MVCYLSFFTPLHLLILSRNPRGLPYLEGVAESDYRRMLETIILDESLYYKAPFTETGLWTLRLDSLRRAPLDEVCCHTIP